MATLGRADRLVGQALPGAPRSVLLAGAGIALAGIVTAIAGLPLVFAAVLVAVLLGLVLIIVEPALGLYLAVLSVPVQELVVLPAGLTITQVVVVLAFGAWLLRVLAHPERAIRLHLLAPWLIFLAVQLLSIAFTTYSPIEGVLQFARWVASFLAFILALGTINGPRHAWGLVAALLLGPAFAAAIGVLQFAIPSLAPDSFLILGGDFARASGTFGKPNSYAGYLNMAWPLALALAGYWAGRARTKHQEPRFLVLGSWLSSSAPSPPCCWPACSPRTRAAGGSAPSAASERWRCWPGGARP